MGCPGWLRGSRFKAVTKSGRYLLFYDAETADAFESDVYYARLRSPTEMSRAIFPKFRDTWRTVCTVERRLGDGIAAAVLTLRLGANDPVPFEALAALAPAPARSAAGPQTVGQAHTTEKDLRPAPDRQIDRAIVAVFWSVEDAEKARAAHAPSAEVFALRHTVSKSDLGP